MIASGDRLRGDEIRACWEIATSPAETVTAGPSRRVTIRDEPATDRTPVRRLEFVEVHPAETTPPPRVFVAVTAPQEVAASLADDGPITATPAEPAWSLWGDAEI